MFARSNARLCVFPMAAFALLTAAVSGAEPPDNSPFDGQWSLEFRVNTKPGGETFTTTQGMAVSAYNLNFHAASRPFRFQDDRSVKLVIREPASLAISQTARYGDVTLWDRQQHRGLVLVEGRGTGDEQDRQVSLTIRWIGVEGNGFVSDSFGTSSNYRWRYAEDAATVTISNEAGSGTFPFKMWKSAWELKPESIERTEISPDVIVETATYRSQRATRLTPLDPKEFSPPLPVIEEIKLKQVRQLNLVPRG